ncbi:hypothetical protein H8N03_06595 [Ramlibacter sp. USB13]|uniref:Uncharacterized protein n=1 Tax=Ramlibacter cellulosilyticus TaxID=2764187 RepID=A0A923SE57_9BURK|nr:hypothetical protein [Ramlibacter cellulosilyticus]MBC5782607.1 hypothetical protein [Ramlibacter cellulosilyticus]
MSHDASPAIQAVSPSPGGAPAAAAAALPTIDRWLVAGHDRIVGVLRDGTSPRHGKKIITSPVVRMRIRDDGARVAQTQSGSRYVLAAPAAGFGAERAEQFVRFKCSVPSSQELPPLSPDLQTGLLKLQG